MLKYVCDLCKENEVKKDELLFMYTRKVIGRNMRFNLNVKVISDSGSKDICRSCFLEAVKENKNA